MNAIVVTDRDERYGYIDFTVSSDAENVYRYEASTGKMRKLFGFGSRNFGKALRGNERKAAEDMARIAYENQLPFVLYTA